MNKINIVDSHCHLNLIEEGGANIDDIINEALLNNVTIMQNVCVDLSKFLKVYYYAERYSNVYSSLGIHPLYCLQEEYNKELMEQYVALEKVTAIGECGLDYSRGPTIEEKQIQQKYFLLQIDLAARHDLPLIIHTRDAEEKTYELLEAAVRRRSIRGVMHCFTGTKELAFKMIELGFYIGFSGIVTFKKNVEYLKELARELPFDKILVETDSPYLSPEPYRGQKNHPARTSEVVKTIALLRNISYEEVAKQTTENYKRLFNKVS